MPRSRPNSAAQRNDVMSQFRKSRLTRLDRRRRSSRDDNLLGLLLIGPETRLLELLHVSEMPLRREQWNAR